MSAAHLSVGAAVFETYSPETGGNGVPTGPLPGAPATGGNQIGRFEYDLMGRLTLQEDHSAYAGLVGASYSRSIAYNAKGQVTTDEVVTVKARYLASGYDTYKSVTTYGYGAGPGYALGSVVTQAATNTKLAWGASGWTGEAGDADAPAIYGDTGAVSPKWMWLWSLTRSVRRDIALSLLTGASPPTIC